MRKALLAVLAFSMVLFISACSSAEEKEVLNFHNDMVDDLYPLYEEFDQVGIEITGLFSEEDVYELFDTKLVPIAEEMEEFFASYDLETDVAQEYYDLRKEANEYVIEFIYIGRDLISDYLDGDISEEEFNERDLEMVSYMESHVEVSEQADDRWDEIFDEYGFRELKE